jgi:hypothetical protein
MKNLKCVLVVSGRAQTNRAYLSFSKGSFDLGKSALLVIQTRLFRYGIL